MNRTSWQLTAVQGRQPCTYFSKGIRVHSVDRKHSAGLLVEAAQPGGGCGWGTCRLYPPSLRHVPNPLLCPRPLYFSQSRAFHCYLWKPPWDSFLELTCHLVEMTSQPTHGTSPSRVSTPSPAPGWHGWQTRRRDSSPTESNPGRATHDLFPWNRN